MQWKVGKDAAGYGKKCACADCGEKVCSRAGSGGHFKRTDPDLWVRVSGKGSMD